MRALDPRRRIGQHPHRCHYPWFAGTLNDRWAAVFQFNFDNFPQKEMSILNILLVAGLQMTPTAPRSDGHCDERMAVDVTRRGTCDQSRERSTACGCV